MPWTIAAEEERVLLLGDTHRLAGKRKAVESLQPQIDLDDALLGCA
jgi:hypothetical protein